MLELNQLYNLDCMCGMAQIPDKYFDLAIVDPPYFAGPNKRRYYGSASSSKGIKRIEYPMIDDWAPPDESYFTELYRVSKQQIVWGCNYFHQLFGSGRIVWDKCNGESSFSDCEVAFCSMHDSVRLFRYMWNGMMQGKSINEGWIAQGNKTKNECRIHPTQKPIALYEWLLTRYAQKDWRILDTHVGSASSLIACERLGYDYIGFEVNSIVYKLALSRMEQERAQIKLY